ncbi:MAG TPA: InlB B-repeat-containing protein, partial [Rudaea sp.]|nr:InlB B-repeat-containing protein [Rudaea sp.]
ANGTISGTSPQTVNYGGNGSLVTAMPNTGYHFVQWSDGVLTAARTDTNVQANISVTATFAIDQFTLTYAAGTGGSINGNSSQTVDYQGNGTAVGAVPDAGYHFVQWSDGITDNPRADANVTADVDVTAQFAANVLVFTVQPADVALGNTLATVEVTEQDGSGNTIVDNATVGLTLVTVCGTLDLGSVQMVDGVATLNSSQRFYTLHSGYQITATVTNPNPTPMVAVLSATFDATASAELVFSDGFESCRP